MKTINAFAVGMRTAGDARTLRAAAHWPAHAAASAHVAASAPAAQRKRRTAAAIGAFVDGGIT
jgi:hypothetical protein